MKFSFLSLLLGLFITVSAQAANVNYSGTVTLGGTSSGGFWMNVNGTNKFEAGGNITGSSVSITGLGSLSLTQMYCVDLFSNATLNTTYQASFNADAIINNVVLTAGGKIAWLINNVAPTATSTAQYQALQGLIWELLYPGSVVYNSSLNSASANAYHNQYLALLGNNTAAVNSVLWINPLNAPNGTYAYQGFVGAGTLIPVIAEPSSLLIFALAMLFALNHKYRRFNY